MSEPIDSVLNKIDGMKSLVTDTEELRLISIIEVWLHEANEETEMENNNELRNSK